MIFEEWVEKYGIESARHQFGLSDHMVFTIRPKKYVVAQCGRWVASEPLAGGESLEAAIDRLRAAVRRSFITEETIYPDNPEIVTTVKT